MYYNDNNDKLAGVVGVVMGVTMLLLSVGVWLVSGYWLWNKIGVTGFGSGLLWFVAWGFVGGLAQSFIVPLLSMPIVLVLSIFSGEK